MISFEQKNKANYKESSSSQFQKYASKLNNLHPTEAPAYPGQFMPSSMPGQGSYDSYMTNDQKRRMALYEQRKAMEDEIERQEEKALMRAALISAASNAQSTPEGIMGYSGYSPYRR